MFNQTIPPITKNLLIINGLFFLATLIFESRGISLSGYLAAFYPESVNFKGWQIVTHMFMHGSFSHILFNMFALYSFGSVVETTLGQKKFMILYFAAGLGSFLLFNFTNYLQVEQLKPILIDAGVNVPQFISDLKFNTAGRYMLPSITDYETVKQFAMHYVTPMVGASGAIYGLLVGFGVLFPDAKLGIIFLPIQFKAKYFIPILIAIEFYMGLQNYDWNPVAHFAHIGGAIIGFILVRNWKKNLFRNRW